MQRARQKFGIAVEEKKVAALALPDCLIVRTGEAEIGTILQQLYPWKLGFYHRGAPVRGGVVYDDKLDRPLNFRAGGSQRREAGLQLLSCVPANNYDR